MPIIKVGTIYLYPIFLNLMHEKRQCYPKYFFVVFTSQDAQIYFIFYGFFILLGYLEFKKYGSGSFTTIGLPTSVSKQLTK